MIIYPAIDLRGGNVVRLRQGDPDQQTTYSDDPVATAARWIEAGAQWLHVVNLDGALSEAGPNERIIEQLCKLPVSVQFGGGLRTVDDVAWAVNAGVARVVLGTAAVFNPVLVQSLLTTYGAERIAIALDARDGLVSIFGWQQKTDFTPAELGTDYAQMGIKHALYTDVNRDGELSGANITATAALAKQTGLLVIASGGVSSVEEIRDLRKTELIAGAVIGKALYDGHFTLQDALAAVR